MAIGIYKNELKYGIVSFLACAGVGILGGAILAVPACGLATYAILTKANKPKEA